MSCFCDYDAPEFYSAQERTARKLHKCCECGHVIQPGERYEHVSAKWEGDVSSVKTCLLCVDLRESLAEAEGGCFLHGGLFEDYWEYLSNVFFSECDSYTSVYWRVLEKHRAGAR